jgi:hypothetical protein
VNPTLIFDGQNHTKEASDNLIAVIGGGMNPEWTDIQSLKTFLSKSRITLRPTKDLNDFTLSVRNTFGI